MMSSWAFLLIFEVDLVNRKLNTNFKFEETMGQIEKYQMSKAVATLFEPLWASYFYVLFVFYTKVEEVFLDRNKSV